MTTTEEYQAHADAVLKAQDVEDNARITYLHAVKEFDRLIVLAHRERKLEHIGDLTRVRNRAEQAEHEAELAYQNASDRLKALAQMGAAGYAKEQATLTSKL